MSRVGICGAGLMGTGIAQVFATAGYDVAIFDVDPGAALRAIDHIRVDLKRGVELGKVEPEVSAAIQSHLGVVDEMSGLAGAQVVVEAVAEDLAVKAGVFTVLDQICPPPALLLSNTSTLSPTEVARSLAHPERFCGLHFFNPAPRMHLVEVLPGKLTSSETITRVRDIADRIDKQAVVANESPGGIVSRLQLLVRNEAIRMLSEGVASAEDIDTAMKLGSGWPMGPIELSDLVGLDTHVNNSDLLAEALADEAFRPDPVVRQLVDEGHLGRKTGRGFYRYDQ